MSRGPGRIEQAIETLFSNAPSQTFSTEELVTAVFPDVNRIEKKHRVAVLRAADKVAKRRHRAKWQCERWFQGGGRPWLKHPSLAGRGSIYINMLDVHSYTLGRLRVDSFNAGRSIAELEEELHKDKWAEFMKRGGAYWLFVEEAKAKAGFKLDHETRRMIRERDKRTKASNKKLVAAIRGVSPERSQEEQKRRQRRDEANKHARLCGKCGQAIAANQPIARMPVMTRGFVGRGATLEVQCLDCAGPNLSYTLNQHEPAHCAFCGRGVYDRWRRHRRRSFCCEICRRKWKARSAPVSGAARRAEASRTA
jgi:hypothetical protein